MAKSSVVVVYLQLQLQLQWLVLVLLEASSTTRSSSLPGCRDSCGGVNIPYPFGIGLNCSLNPNFDLNCSKNAAGVDRPFKMGTEIVNISLADGNGLVLNPISWVCNNGSSSGLFGFLYGVDLTLPDLPYKFSDAENKFTVVGCNTLAYIVGQQSNNSYQSGCVAVCQNNLSLADGSCAGLGCCQTSVPKDLGYYEVSFDSRFNGSSAWNSSNCSYAVLMQASSFTFKTSYLTTNHFLMQDNYPAGMAPVVVDWVVGKQTCEQAKLNLSSYACVSDDSQCFDAGDGFGYICHCQNGYQGNPYLIDGCQDIDECTTDLDRYPCYGLCENIPGSYNCSCRSGTQGNATIKGGCSPIPQDALNLTIKLLIGGFSGTIFLLSCVVGLYIVYQRRRLKEMKKKYFNRHGGPELMEKMKSTEGYGLAFQIFASYELEKATNNFDDELVIGRGGNGIVYEGVLEDKRVVAIKKPMIINEDLRKNFGMETLILSRINHENIVKLLGCCLETEVPILVYEFVPNGTLSHLIHASDHQDRSLSLDTRLRIAYESANALDYLHSKALPRIIHGDVKPSNILLDENYTAKVSDFGASKLIPKGEKQFATLMQFTHGYIDPECLMTYELTYKSDVYSFGVVLLELITGKKVVNFEESAEDQRSLVSTFSLLMNEGRALDILDHSELAKTDIDIELIREVFGLINRCLKLKGEERPEMKEVADELDALRKWKQHPWEVKQYVEESERLLQGGSPNAYVVDSNLSFDIERINVI